MDGQGFEVLAINTLDSEELAREYIDSKELTYLVGIAGTLNLEETYGVRGFPTNYLIGADGTVLYRSVGFDPAGLRAALKKLGIGD